MYDSHKSDEEWQRLHDIHLDECKEKFETGDSYALFLAIAYCGNEQIIIPEWAVQALYDGMRKFAHYKVKTLDDAFGITWPHKGTHLKTLEEERRWGLQILNRVSEYSIVGWPIDEGNFEKVGEELGLTTSKVRDIYYKYPSDVRQQVLDGTPRHPRKPTPTPIPRK